jgi:hypothetical protein
MINGVSAERRADNERRLRPYAKLRARPWFAAPPVRVVSKPGAEVLTMYTIQSGEAYETLARDGVLIGDSSLGWDHVQEAYAWMLRQMERRLPGSGAGLLWLWPAATREQLRDSAKHSRGGVMLTVKVARERVLLSEFSDWHSSLNRSVLVPQMPGETGDEWDQRWTTLDDDFRARAEPYDSLPISEWPTDLRAEIEASWEAIFDPATWPAKPALQATMHELRPADVVRAVRIL